MSSIIIPDLSSLLPPDQLPSPETCQGCPGVGFRLEEEDMDRILSALSNEAEDLRLAGRMEPDVEDWPVNWKPAKKAQVRKLEELTEPSELERMPSMAVRWLVSFLDGPPENCSRAQQVYALSMINRLDRGKVGELIGWLKKATAPKGSGRRSWRSSSLLSTGR